MPCLRGSVTFALRIEIENCVDSAHDYKRVFDTGVLAKVWTTCL